VIRSIRAIRAIRTKGSVSDNVKIGLLIGGIVGISILLAAAVIHFTPFYTCVRAQNALGIIPKWQTVLACARENSH
jgi:hypothetical protein